MQWCRSRVKGEYGERQIIIEINSIESEANRIVNSNPDLDEQQACKLLIILHQQLVDLDLQLIEPVLRRFAPLLNAWGSDFDAVFHTVAQLPVEGIPPQVQGALKDLERLLDVATPGHPGRASLTPLDISALVVRQRDLMGVIEEFARR